MFHALGEGGKKQETTLDDSEEGFRKKSFLLSITGGADAFGKKKRK